MTGAFDANIVPTIGSLEMPRAIFAIELAVAGATTIKSASLAILTWSIDNSVLPS